MLLKNVDSINLNKTTLGISEVSKVIYDIKNISCLEGIPPSFLKCCNWTSTQIILYIYQQQSI